MEHIGKVIQQLRSKLDRQEEAVRITKAHINHLEETNLGRRLDLEDEQKEATSKKK